MDIFELHTVQHFVISLVSYGFGIVTGLFLSDVLKEKTNRLFDKDNGNHLVLIIVTSVWFLSMIIDIMSPEYETSPYVHGLMGAIVGFFYRKQNEANNK